MSNIRSSTMGMTMYAADAKGLIPVYYRKVTATESLASWADALVDNGYLPPTAPAAACPAYKPEAMGTNFDGSLREGYGALLDLSRWDKYFVSTPPSNLYRFVNTQAVRSPDAYPLLLDTYYPTYDSQYFAFDYAQAASNLAFAVHGDRINIGDLTGRVQAVSPEGYQAMIGTTRAEAGKTSNDVLGYYNQSLQKQILTW